MFANGIKQTTTTTGTGNLTLSSVSGFPTFASKFSTGTNGDPFHYAIIRDSDGVGMEWGIGHLSSSTVLVRDKILATWDGTSTYSDQAPTALSLAAGTYRVICVDNAAARPIAANAVDTTLSGATKYLLGAQIVANPGANVAFANGTCQLVPFRLDQVATVSGVSVKVNTLASTGTTKNMRGAIYAVDKDGHPGNLIAESSAGVSTATTGVKGLTFAASVRLLPGWYFIALLTDGNPNIAGSNAAAGGGQCPMWGTAAGDVGGRYVVVTKSITYADTGALFPSPFGTTGLTYGADWVSLYPTPTLMVTA